MKPLFDFTVLEDRFQVTCASCKADPKAFYNDSIIMLCCEYCLQVEVYDERAPIHVHGLPFFRTLPSHLIHGLCNQIRVGRVMPFDGRDFTYNKKTQTITIPILEDEPLNTKIRRITYKVPYRKLPDIHTVIDEPPF